MLVSMSSSFRTTYTVYRWTSWASSNNVFPGDIGTSGDGVTDSLAFETGLESGYVIGGVGDLNQSTSSLWTGWSGCSPTSAANIMLYWSSRGYPQLTQGLTTNQLLLQLRNVMGTSDSGSTPVNNISPGMQSFARSRGLNTAIGSWIDPPEWEAFKSSLQTKGPNVISFLAQTYFGTHSVTGMGWIEYSYSGSSTGHQYMVVHDNWSGTPQDVYIAYGRNYSALYYDQFSVR